MREQGVYLGNKIPIRYPFNVSKQDMFVSVIQLKEVKGGSKAQSEEFSQKFSLSAIQFTVNSFRGVFSQIYSVS